MNTEHYKEQLLAYLCGELDREQEQAIRLHLTTCESCRKESETISAFWNSLTLLPQEQPSDILRERFYDNLQQALQEQQHPHSRNLTVPMFGWLERLFPKPMMARFALVLLLLGIGGYAGFQLRQPNQQVQPQANTNELTQLHQEVLAMNRLLTVSLLQQQSASERLKGVSLSYRVEGSDPEITAALLQALKYDPNVNVRLAALDALINDREYAPVQDELIQSLPKQSSPLVQLEIVDWIVEHHQKESVEVLRKMLKQGDINKAVKQRIEQGLQELNS